MAGASLMGVAAPDRPKRGAHAVTGVGLLGHQTREAKRGSFYKRPGSGDATGSLSAWGPIAILRSGAASRRSGRTLRDALDHRGRDAREHCLDLRGLQYVEYWVRPWRLPLRLATAEDIPKLTGLLM